MAGFVLVHGGSHGGWCWERLVSELEADVRAQEVVALDLIGHGARLDEKPLGSICLADYVDDIAGAAAALRAEDVILVGHSLAGISLPQAAARLPDLVRRAILVSASIPAEGQSLDELMTHPQSPISLGFEPRAMFCSDLDAETADWLLSRLGPEPPGPMREPVSRGRLPASLKFSYVLLGQDRTLIPEFQRQMCRNLAIEDVVELDAGHSAMVSRPRELAEILLRYA